MGKILRFFLASGQKRRRRAIRIIIGTLKLLQEAEEEETRRYSDSLDKPDSGPKGGASWKYNDIEDMYLSAEHAWYTIESVIDDLEWVYW